MSQILSLQEMTDRLAHLEQLMNVISQEVAELRRQMVVTLQPQTTKAETTITYPWVDKGLQRHWINQLFNDLAIQGESIGAEALQRKMRQAGLSDNELSRALIEARDYGPTHLS